jgi:hypothetical protein
LGLFTGIFGHFPVKKRLFRAKSALFRKAISRIAVFYVRFRAHRGFFLKARFAQQQRGDSSL